MHRPREGLGGVGAGGLLALAPVDPTPSHLSAELNVARARQLRGLTQSEASAEVAGPLGRRWSTASWSALGRSVDPHRRTCAFDINDLVALARGFRLSIGWFLTAPPDEDARLAIPDSDPEGADFGVLVDVALGDSVNRREWTELLARARSVHKPTVEIAEMARTQAELAVTLTFGSTRAARDTIDRFSPC